MKDRALLLLAAAGLVAILCWPSAPGETGPFDLEAWASLPVSADGRVKPLDTVARTNLLLLSNRQQLRLGDKSLSAVPWLAEVMFAPERAEEYNVFRVQDPGILEMFSRDGSQPQRLRLKDILPLGQQIFDQARLAEQVPAGERSLYQRGMLELFSHLQRYIQLSRLEQPYLIPPLTPQEEWRPLDFMAAMSQAQSASPSVPAFYFRMREAYRQSQPAAFNQAVAEYRQILSTVMPRQLWKAGVEVGFNRYEPFYRSMLVYGLAIGLAILFWLGGSWQARQAGAWVMLAGWLVHTMGLATRVALQGRPPVTNLYSSAVFVGWACVGLGLFLEKYFRNGLGIVTSATVGFLSLLVAHHLAEGDTMQMMQAVLDTNFWLATHVVAITIGYSATFLAGFLGITYIVQGFFTRRLTRAHSQNLARMIYGVVCFALLFSFVGTVLGGIWADQSWGRFWGWDPKENGAALIVLMNALVLHARWGGLIQERGLATLAVCGNIVTAWSWFGTNMLGVGLHSYGFMDSAALWLALFVASQLLVMAIGTLPLDHWRSFAAKAAPTPGSDATPQVPTPA
ncbi:MAG: cytochrome c biogenesis protein CcsA [Phycisphaeraceae bacterium]|nr:cytochrome c biogenesis protein CcsA [Phycisphaeraceae bacterium]